MKTTVALVVCVLAVFVSYPAKTQQSADKVDPNPVNLWPEDKALFIASDLTVKVRQGEAEAIQFLQSIPAESREDRQEGPPAAMEFLGTIRSVKAVPILCDRLLWEKFHNEVVGHQLQYPASAALVQIGTPAVDGLLTRVAAVDVGKKYRQVVIGVLVDVLGKDNVAKAIDDFKITDDRTDKVEGRKRLDGLKGEFKALYAPESKPF